MASYCKLLTSLVCLLMLWSGFAQAQETIRIGSKNFNESYLLGEILAQLYEAEGFRVERNFGMSGTLVTYEALRSGEVDVYVEYTGTLAQVVLANSPFNSMFELNNLLQGEGVEALEGFGFNNTYAIAMKRQQAQELGVSTISELVVQPGIDLGFSVEFMNRSDGWPGLQATYGFSQQPLTKDHGLAYQAIDAGTIDVTDAYSTDGDIEFFELVILEDDRGLFPNYLAVPLISSSMSPRARGVITPLIGRIDDERMRELNSRVMIDGQSFAEAANDFLREEGLVSGESLAQLGNSMWQDLGRNTLVHLQLTLIALGLGCAVGVPLGVAVYRSRNLSRSVLYVAGLMQTIPSIALLALLIPLLGIGQVPAIVALFLYSLLPILRSTVTALITIDPLLKRVAEAIGMTRIQQLRHVLIPLALPNVLSGIKTAAIISIGTATLAAFIGAGGLGEPIVTGLALNDTSLILQGAIPAACLAIVTELLFELLERKLVKPHMLAGRLPA